MNRALEVYDVLREEDFEPDEMAGFGSRDGFTRGCLTAVVSDEGHTVELHAHERRGGPETWSARFLSAPPEVLRAAIRAALDVRRAEMLPVD